MKKVLAACVTLCVTVFLFNPMSVTPHVNAQQASQAFDVQLKSTPHVMEDWVVDGTFSINTPTSVAKGNDEYIAVGNYGSIMKSVDGKSWTALTRFNNYQLTAIGWTGSHYVLAGADTEYADHANYTQASIFISDDGLGWNEVEFTYDDSIQYIEVSDNVIVASGIKGIYASKDGFSWDKVYSFADDTYQYHPMQVVNGQFFIIAYETNELLTSKDGQKWTKNNLDSEASVQQMIYYNNQYIGVGYAGGLYTSTNGMKWTKLTGVPQDTFFKSIATDGKQVVVMGIGSKQTEQLVYTSKNLSTWAKNDLSSLGHNMFSIFPVSDGFAGIGFSQNGPIYAMHTKDGLNWTHKLIGATIFSDFEALATNGKRVVAVGGQGMIVYTDNGTKWNSANPPVNREIYGITYFNDIVYGASKFVTVGNDGIYYSKDGYSWTKSSSIKSNESNFNNVIWAGSYFVASGQGTGVYFSKDGMSWSKANIANNQTLMSMVYDGKRIVAGFHVYDEGNVHIQMMQTIDGNKWNKLTSFNTTSIEVGYTNSTYLAYDPYATQNMWLSKDAKSWTKVDVPDFMINDSLPTLLAMDNYFVLFNHAIVKENGEYVTKNKYYSSSNGKDWKEHTLPNVQNGEIFGTNMIKDGIKAYGKYMFVGSQGYMFNTTDLQLTKPVSIFINGAELKQSAHAGRAYIDNGTTYLPLRVIGEALGYEVIWNEVTRDVTFKNNEQSATFTEIRLKNDKSYVGVRAVSEKLGYQVGYEIDAKKADIFIDNK